MGCVLSACPAALALGIELDLRIADRKKTLQVGFDIGLRVHLGSRVRDPHRPGDHVARAAGRFGGLTVGFLRARSDGPYAGMGHGRAYRFIGQAELPRDAHQPPRSQRVEREHADDQGVLQGHRMGQQARIPMLDDQAPVDAGLPPARGGQQHFGADPGRGNAMAVERVAQHHAQQFAPGSGFRGRASRRRGSGGGKLRMRLGRRIGALGGRMPNSCRIKLMGVPGCPRPSGLDVSVLWLSIVTKCHLACWGFVSSERAAAFHCPVNQVYRQR